MAMPMNRSLVFSSCSLLMGSLFAYSASVQLNDPDWYLWFPLYASASAVNLFPILNRVARLAFWLGMVLFLKVLVEDHVDGIAGFWSLDMDKRVVREKLGSGLVVISMFLKLKASAVSDSRLKGNGE